MILRFSPIFDPFDWGLRVGDLWKKANSLETIQLANPAERKTIDRSHKTQTQREQLSQEPVLVHKLTNLAKLEI